MKIEILSPVFNARSSRIGGKIGFVEIIRPSALDRWLRTDPDLVSLNQHDPSQLLGRSSAGNLRFTKTAKGLVTTVTLPKTQAGRDVGVSVERGDLVGSSFSFSVAEDGDVWSKQGNDMLRELLDIDVFETSPVTFPAYPQATVDVAEPFGEFLGQASYSAHAHRAETRSVEFAWLQDAKGNPQPRATSGLTEFLTAIRTRYGSLRAAPRTTSRWCRRRGWLDAAPPEDDLDGYFDRRRKELELRKRMK